MRSDYREKSINPAVSDKGLKYRVHVVVTTLVILMQYADKKLVLSVHQQVTINMY